MCEWQNIPSEHLYVWVNEISFKMGLEYILQSPHIRGRPMLVMAQVTPHVILAQTVSYLAQEAYVGLKDHQHSPDAYLHLTQYLLSACMPSSFHASGISI